MCEQQKNKPHVHAELIKAWADGAIIERLWDVAGWEVCVNPLWQTETKYRIKPPKKSPGQIAFEAYAAACKSGVQWKGISTPYQQHWENAAQAVIDSLSQK